MPEIEPITGVIKKAAILDRQPRFHPDADFVNCFDYMARRVHKLSRESGLWESEKTRTRFLEIMSCAHSELGEALECFRTGNGPDKNIDDMSGVEVQLSDVLGCLMDMAAGFNLDIANALLKKMDFNSTRDFKHGGKIF
jgi:NTP pyrophosphatase (non-canonical NTP hydrolase)